MAIRNLRYQGDEILKKKSREVPEGEISTEKIQYAFKIHLQKESFTNAKRTEYFI